MSEAHDNRLVAARLPHADLIAVLFVQHARVKDLMAQVSAAAGTERTMLFEHLTATIKAHETAEEAVVRPITKEAAGSEVADARNAEEREADEVIAALTERTSTVLSSTRNSPSSGRRCSTTLQPRKPKSSRASSRAARMKSA